MGLSKGRESRNRRHSFPHGKRRRGEEWGSPQKNQEPDNPKVRHNRDLGTGFPKHNKKTLRAEAVRPEREEKKGKKRGINVNKMEG